MSEPTIPPHWIYWNGIAWSFDPPAMWDGRVIPKDLRKYVKAQHGEFVRASRTVERAYGYLVQRVPHEGSPHRTTAEQALNASRDYMNALIDLSAAIQVLDGVFHTLKTAQR